MESAQFFERVNKNGPTVPYVGTPCWQWIGGAAGEYGGAWFERRQELAHRISWILHFGKIPGGMFVLHKCDNKLCVNPEHLFLGTQADNMRDKVEKGRQARGDRNGARLHPESRARGERHGSRTHPECVARGDANGSRKHPECIKRGEQLPTAKLTAEKVVGIRERRSSGATLAQIAGEFGITFGRVSAIVRRKAWRHVA